MLAPIIIGMALSMVMEPEATNATTKLVAVELLCIMAVISRPIKSAVNGLEVAKRMASAAVLPRFCSDEIIKSRANTNNTNVPSMYRIFLNRSQLKGVGRRGVGGVLDSNSISLPKCRNLKSDFRKLRLQLIHRHPGHKSGADDQGVFINVEGRCMYIRSYALAFVAGT